MTRFSLKGLASRPLRTTLTALAIVLGVAMVSAAYTLTDTFRSAANSLSSAAYDGTDAAITTKTEFKTDPNSDVSGQVPIVSSSTLARVRRQPNVGVAVGDITDLYTKIIDKKGKPIGDGPYFGVGFDAKAKGSQALTPFRLAAGRYASGPGQVVIDKSTADKQHLSVGDRVRVASQGPARSYTVSGIARFGDVASLGTATAVVFDLPTAQKLFGKTAGYDSILVRATPGTSGAALRSQLRSALPGNLQVQTASAQDRYTLDGLKQFLSIIKGFLLAFGFVAIFVGAFTIYNTLSITVAQRSRELAMLRTIGASRRQVMRTVLLEAFVIGVLASILGIVGGLGLAHGLNAILQAFGLDLPQSSLGLAGRTIAIAALVGIVVTVLAGLGPAMRATRVSPVIALREGAHVPPGRVGRRGPIIGGVLAVLGLGVIVYGMFAGGLDAGQRLISLAPGCLLLFFGVALLSPRLARPLASWLGKPGARLGGAAGELARQNAMRNPKRTAVTAAALMIGIALVAFVAVLGQGLNKSATGDINDSLRAGTVISGEDGYSPIDPKATLAAAKVPGVTDATGLSQDVGRAYKKKVLVDGVDPAAWSKVWDYKWSNGSQSTLAGLSGDKVLVRKKFADKHHLGVGDTFAITTIGKGRQPAQVAGIVKVSDLNPMGLGDVTFAKATFRKSFSSPRDRFAFVNGGSQAGIKSALASFPDAKVQTAKQWQDAQAKGILQLLGIVYVFLALAVIVSLFGIVNTLALAVFERTREIGMLRAVGMTRRQVRRMVRHESITTALMGAVLGIAVGVVLGALVTSALSKYGLAFALPVGSIIVFLIVAVVAGMLAAILPARRAARLDPLGALAYE